MKPNFSQPNYGPSHLDLNLEVEPRVNDVVDAVLRLSFLAPLKKLLPSLFSPFRSLNRKESGKERKEKIIPAMPSRGLGRQTSMKT